jgi:hypothetical protein
MRLGFCYGEHSAACAVPISDMRTVRPSQELVTAGKSHHILKVSSLSLFSYSCHKSNTIFLNKRKNKHKISQKSYTFAF